MPSMPEICDQSPTAVIWWSMQMTPILSSLKGTLHHIQMNWSTSTKSQSSQDGRNRVLRPRSTLCHHCPEFNALAALTFLALLSASLVNGWTCFCTVGHLCKNTVWFVVSPSPWSSPRLSGRSVPLYGTGQAAVLKSCMVMLLFFGRQRQTWQVPQ